MHRLLHNLRCVPLVAVILACGAPSKSAGDVGNLFKEDSATLQDKEDAVCEALRTRSEPPTAVGLSLDLSDCGDAGKAALDYRRIGTGGYAESFRFFDAGVPTGSSDDDLLVKSMRAQVWLNKSLIGLAQAIASKMKENQGLEGGVLSLPDSAGGKGLGGLATPKLTVLQKPVFDLETFSFSMKINLKVTGVVEADHDIVIDGRMLDNVFAVTIKTTEDRPYEKSIIKRFSAVLLIIPHASDVYLDLFTDLSVHKPGLDAAVDQNVTKFLGTGLKGAIDSIMAL